MRSRGFGVRGLLIGCVVWTASCGSSDEGAVSGNGGGNGGDGTSGSSGSSMTGAGGAANGGSNTTGNGGSNTTGDGGSNTTGNGGSLVGGSAGTTMGGRGGRMNMAGTNGGGMGGMSANCPMTEPMNMDMCTTATPMGATGCSYATTGDVCVCRGRMGNLTWRCARGMGGMGGAAGAAGMGGMGGNASNCPMTAPTAGDMCTRAMNMTQSNTCRYGTDVCTCERGATATMSTWACLTCPMTMPMNGSACMDAGSCNYTMNGNQRTCTCRTPAGAGGASADGGADMTWVCR